MGEVIFVIVGLTLIIILEYSMLVTAKRADEEAERMFREWSEKRGQNEDKGVLSDDE